MKNKRIKIATIISVALLTVVTVGVTLAWLSDKSTVLNNTVSIGSVKTQIDEEGEGEVKKSRIQNMGENDCLVRARVTISPAEAADAIMLTDGNGKDVTSQEAQKNGWNWSEWTNGGYVYYEHVLPYEGEKSYTSYLFEEVKLKSANIDWKSLGIENFDVTIYEESVQVRVHDGKEMISAIGEDGNYDHSKAMEVWKVYDSATKVE